MSNHNEETQSPSSIPSSSSFVPEYGISPMSTLSVNLCANLHIRRNLTFHSNDSTPQKGTDSDQNVAVSGGSPNRMLKHTKISSGLGGSPTNNHRSFSRRFNHPVSGSKAPTNKENSSSRRSYSMDYSLGSDDEFSPSKFAIVRSISRERYPLEDQDPNSQDSGFSNCSSSFSEDSKSSSNFRFAEPNGVAPRRTMAVEFSPTRDTSPSSKKAVSPRYRKQLLHRISMDSTSSDFSDDGFGDNLALPSVDSMLMEQDENARLPANFGTLLSGSIFNLSKITESPNPSSETTTNVLQTSFRRSLTENLTPNRTVIRSTVDTEFNELLMLEKDPLKRSADEEESAGPFLKKRKSCCKLITPSNSNKSWPSGPATAPPTTTSTRGTLFSYGFKKTSVKFQRSFSETEATIKNALQRATSDPNLIGDFSKPCILPLKIGRVTDLKNIDCHTLANLISGEYKNIVSSYSIIDCRYPYEYEGGHIKGAVNIYTKEQMMEELNENKLLPKSSAGPFDSNNLIFSQRNILIFHCEFSSERGPSLSRYLRNADREKNSLKYPKLDYPEIYLLEGGYQKFYDYYKDLCEPREYVKMVDPNHSETLRKLKVPSKSWASNRDNRKFRNSYKRLGL